MKTKTLTFWVIVRIYDGAYLSGIVTTRYNFNFHEARHFRTQEDAYRACTRHDESVEQVHVPVN